MKIIALFFLFCSAFNAATGQEAVFFFADDSVKVRASLYIKNNDLPFIILCPQNGSDRSEYNEIAPRLLNLDYNCLAIDLRAGTSLTQLNDIKGAIRFVRGISNQPVVLIGAAQSASLCILAAGQNPSIKAVIALNPGEFFQPQKKISEEVKKLHQPVFVCSTQAEYPYIQKMLAALPSEQLTLFKPAKAKGIRGPQAFSRSNPDNGEYWFALTMFFKKISYISP